MVFAGKLPSLSLLSLRTSPTLLSAPIPPWFQAHGVELRLRGGGNKQSLDGELKTASLLLLADGTAESREMASILEKHNLVFKLIDVGSQHSLRAEAARRMRWDTFPQLICNGRLLGDLPILKELEADGALLDEISSFKAQPFPQEEEEEKKKEGEGSKKQDLSSLLRSTNDDELVDEDDLLPAAALSSGKDCGETAEGEGGGEKKGEKKGGSRRKACKNCSCGLAQQLSSDQSTSAQDQSTAQPKSACGSCYLGDAFRCASCPYKGLPPFEPGSKVTIAPTSDL